MSNEKTYVPPARGVKPFHLDMGNSVVVGPDDDLAAKYDWLKSSDRDTAMGSLSLENRRCIVLVPGRYELSATLILDTEFVDICSLSSNPADVVVTCSAEQIRIKQTAFDVHLSNFTTETSTAMGTNMGFRLETGNGGSGATTTNATSTVAGTNVGKDLVGRYDSINPDDIYDEVYLSAGSVVEGWYTVDTVVSDDEITVVETLADSSADVDFRTISHRSEYRNMRFSTAGLVSTKIGVDSTYHYSGLWINCWAEGRAWQCSSGMHLRGRYYDCEAMRQQCWCGDTGGTISGQFYRCRGGDWAFGGCTSFGSDISSDAVFEDCTAGIQSFGLGKTVAGTFKRCVGGANSFAGFTSAIYLPTFSGYAEDCISSGDCFAGGHASAVNSGEMVRCTITDMSEAMYLTGAFLRHCRLVISGTNKDCINIVDSNSKLYNCTLVANGSGKAIDAGSSLNVVAAHCRSNLGVGANVTNLLTGSNVLTGAAMGIEDSDIS